MDTILEITPFPLLCRFAFAAYSVYIKGKMRRVEVFHFSVFYDRKQQLLFHFHHFAAHVAYHVVMIFVVICFLILRIHSEFMPDHQTALN